MMIVLFKSTSPTLAEVLSLQNRCNERVVYRTALALKSNRGSIFSIKNKISGNLKKSECKRNTLLFDS